MICLSDVFDHFSVSFSLYQFYNINRWRTLKNIEKQDCSSIVREKGEFQNGCFKKTKHAKFSWERTFLTPWYSHARVRSGGKKCSFSGKFGVLCFLETTVLKFALLPYYRVVL